MEIAVSFLGIKEKIATEIEKLNETEVAYFHFDVMDGNFVTNKTRPFAEDKKIANIMNKSYDVHLMVNNVKEYVDLYAGLEPEWITFHLELGDTEELINYVKEKNIEVGLAINPTTSIDKIIPYLHDIDVVLLMSVPPGESGQSFVEKTITRMEYLINYRHQNNLNFMIQVDGGINSETIQWIKKADVVVVGNYITKSKDYVKQISSLLEN